MRTLVTGPRNSASLNKGSTLAISQGPEILAAHPARGALILLWSPWPLNQPHTQRSSVHTTTQVNQKHAEQLVPSFSPSRRRRPRLDDRCDQPGHATIGHGATAQLSRAPLDCVVVAWRTAV
jgi:hypothetical protein